ncbi:hypothetical protein BJV78DRAFT_158792 [Lactifluus subvellereus]|nr:hypothetical protein BJV78DRAFT_158792 [Lactifluus subvellereus]
MWTSESAPNTAPEAKRGFFLTKLHPLQSASAASDGYRTTGPIVSNTAQHQQRTARLILLSGSSLAKPGAPSFPHDLPRWECNRVCSALTSQVVRTPRGDVNGWSATRCKVTVQASSVPTTVPSCSGSPSTHQYALRPHRSQPISTFVLWFTQTTTGRTGTVPRPGADGDSIRSRQRFWVMVTTLLRTSGTRCRTGDDLTEVVDGTSGGITA